MPERRKARLRGLPWDQGGVVLGPLQTQTHNGEEQGYETTPDLAINRALRALGVVAGDKDESDALGLRRFRDPSEWRSHR